jgi:hypothetical protein
MKMSEPFGPVDYLRRIPFAVASMVALCTQQGSYEREAAQRIYESVRSDIERAIEMLKAQE